MAQGRNHTSTGPAKVRIGFVGCGGMANGVHYPSLVSFPDVEVAAICDINPERLNQTGEKFGIEKRYSDYRAMVEETAPDAVYAIGPPHHMIDVWMWCLSQGQNLFIEKPPGITLEQTRSLAVVAEENGCITQVGFQRRCSPLLVKLRNECLSRGPIVHAVCTFYKFGPSPFLGPMTHMFDDGVHVLDTIRWMCGGEVVSVASRVARVSVPNVNLHLAVIGFDNGSSGVMLTSWSSGRRIFRVEMHSPGICAEAEVEAKGYLYTDGHTEGVEYDTREVAGSDKLHVYAGFEAENRKFIDAVKSRTNPDTNFSDAVKTVELAERVIASQI